VGRSTDDQESPLIKQDTMDVDFNNMGSGGEFNYQIPPVNKNEYSNELGTFIQNRGFYNNDYSYQDNNLTM
jgi:hypothetical protein